MADTVKEIFNSIIRYGELSNQKKTIFTTDANTKYVLKDIQVADSKFSVAPKLLINEMPVANLGGNLSGSEIVDANSNVSLLEVGTPAKLVNIGSLASSDGGSVFYELSTGPETLPELRATTTPNGGASTAVRAFSPEGYNGAIQWWKIGNDFYWYFFDSNSSTFLYRRAGGPNGTTEQIQSNSYRPVAYDESRYFYWFHSSNTFRRYDTQTNTATNISVVGVNNWTTYPSLTYCNGFLFAVPTYSPFNVYAYHIATGIVTNLGNGGSTNISSETFVVPFCDTSEKTIRLIFTSGTNGSNAYRDYKYSDSGTVTNSGQGTVSPATSGLNTRRGNPIADSNYAVLLGSGSEPNSIFVVDRDFKVISKKSTNVNFNNSVGMVSVLTTPTTTQLNDYGPSIRLRITGVQTS